MHELPLALPFGASFEAMQKELAEWRSAVVEPLQPASSYPSFKHDDFGFRDRMASGVSRDRYVFDYGYVLLTQETLAALTSILEGKKVIDVGSGSGFLVHCLREGGINATALDLPTLGTVEHGYWFRQIWALDIADSFEKHLPGDYDAVILSWPNMDSPFAHDVAKAMRPGQILIYQGERQGRCTADDSFFEYLHGDDTIEWQMLDAETARLNEHHRTFGHVKDCWMVYRKTEPVVRSPLAELEKMMLDMRPIWERIMEDIRGSARTDGSCLHAAMMLTALIGQFTSNEARVCGGGPEEGAGLRDPAGNLRGHYWVEGVAGRGIPFIADLTADQFGYPPVVVMHADVGRERYILGDQNLVRQHVAEETARMMAENKAD